MRTINDLLDLLEHLGWSIVIIGRPPGKVIPVGAFPTWEIATGFARALCSPEFPDVSVVSPQHRTPTK